MKPFLSYWGKSLSLLKAHGWRRGGSIILQSSRKILKRISSGDILFMGGFGASALYRCDHVAEELNQQGFKCAVSVYVNPWLLKKIDNFKIFVLQRPIYSKQTQKLIDLLKAKKKEIIFETDDLLFDSQYFQFSDYAKNISKIERKLYESGLGAEILADPYIKVCTTSTSYLAEKIKEKNKKVFVVKNKLSHRDLSIANNILERSKRKQLRGEMKWKKNDSKSIYIGYFSGTKSHDKDFAVVTEPLVSMMKKYTNLFLVIGGPLKINDKLESFEKRIIKLPFVERAKHFENIAAVDINLAPLEIGNPFCEAKSEIKFIEAGIFSVPTVAAKNRTYGEAIEDGKDGFLAAKPEEWFSKIEMLVNDEKMRRTMGEKARQKILKTYTTASGGSDDYYQYIRESLRESR